MRRVQAVVFVLSCECVLMLARPSETAAQTATPSVVDPATLRGQVTFRGQLGMPFGEFSDNVGLSGGIAGEVAYRLADTPLRLGAGMSVLWYGRETRRLPLSETIPDVLVDVTTSSGIWTTYGLLRVQNHDGRVRPYGDLLVGFNYVFTETAADLSEDVFFDQRTVRTTNFRDFAFSAGGGGGVMFELASWTGSRLSLDLGARVLFGGEADYLTPELLGPSRGVADLEVLRSRNDVVTIHGGLTYEF